MTSVNTQNGNVLFLILIAVALFAALSYVVAQSSRSGSGDTSRTKAELAASEILQFVTSARVATMRKSMEGVSLSQMDFSSSAEKRWDGNQPLLTNKNSACTSDRCRIFDVKDSIPYLEFSKYVSTPTTSGNMAGYPAFRFGCIKDIGTALPDLIMIIRNVEPAICAAINAKAGLGSQTVDGEAYTNFAFSSGTFATQMTTSCANSLGDTETSLARRQFLCRSESSSGSFNTAIFTILER